MERFCTNCGKEIPDGIAFCTECGTKAPEQASAPQPVNEPSTVAETPQPQPAPQVQYTPPTPVAQPASFAPADEKKSDTVGTAYYFFMQLLFSIPIIGLIVCIITMSSGNNQSKKNFSKAYLIWLIIGIVLSIVGIIALISVGNSFMDYINSQLGGEYGNIGELFEQFK